MITSILLLLAVQDTPQDIAKKDLPKAAECVICSAGGENHGEEKPAAGVRYKGKAFYFCNAKEVAGFKKNPDFYMPLTLPMALDKFDLTDSSGVRWNAESMKGKLVLIDYWATWCKPCLALKPKLDTIRNTYKGQGYEMLSVSIDERKQVMDAFVAKKPFENPVLWDDKKTWADLRVVSIPALFLVKDGQVIAQFRGGVKLADLEAAIKKAL